MKKFPIIFLVGLLLGCNKSINETNKISKLKLVNKASHFFNGKPEFDLEDKEEINFILDMINSLNEDYSDKISINVNYSYVEVLLVNEKSGNKEFFSIIFTKYNGDIIRYGGKHYFYNPELVNFIKGKLNMRDKPILYN